MAESNLNVRLEAYQNACFKGDEYVGFQCANNCNVCPLKVGDGLEIIDGFNKVRPQMELHHEDGARFSRTRSTYSGQVVPLCIDCHTLEHWDDPSASRRKW